MVFGGWGEQPRLIRMVEVVALTERSATSIVTAVVFCHW